MYKESLIYFFYKFILAWIVGFLFSGAENSNFYIKNKMLNRILFFSKKKATLCSIVYQTFNYSLFIICFSAILIDKTSYEYAQYIYFKGIAYAFLIIGSVFVIDVLYYVYFRR